MEDDRQTISTTSAAKRAAALWAGPPSPATRVERHTLAGPLAVMGSCGIAALPVACYTFGWQPTLLTTLAVGFIVGTVWLLARSAETRRVDSDQDRIRGEAALRHQIADLTLLLQTVAARVGAGDPSDSAYVAGYLTAARRRLSGPRPTGPANRSVARGPDSEGR